MPLIAALCAMSWHCIRKSADKLVLDTIHANHTWLQGTDMERCQEAIFQSQLELQSQVDEIMSHGAAQQRRQLQQQRREEEDCSGDSGSGGGSDSDGGSDGGSEEGKESQAEGEEAEGEEAEEEFLQPWRPVAHEVIDDACARAKALQAQGIDVEMHCSFIEVRPCTNCGCCVVESLLGPRLLPFCCNVLAAALTPALSLVNGTRQRHTHTHNALDFKTHTDLQ